MTNKKLTPKQVRAAMKKQRAMQVEFLRRASKRLKRIQARCPHQWFDATCYQDLCPTCRICGKEERR